MDGQEIVTMGFTSGQLDSDYNAPDTFVCDECVEDEFLKASIRANATEKKCDYCGRHAEESIAAPVEVVIEPIFKTLKYHYEEPLHAGLPWDGEWLDEIRIRSTREALYELGVDEGLLLEDIVEAISNDDWYPCAQGDWLSEHQHKRLLVSWERFRYFIKHRSRYFFLSAETTGGDLDEQTYSPEDLLNKTTVFAETLGLIKTLASNTELFRVRLSDSSSTFFTSFADLGPPPAEKAGAGRMNPIGISYFYLSFEQETALAEVVNRPPCNASIGKFSNTSELRYLDLSELPSTPSIFDRSKAEEREGLLFLKSFVEAISKPTEKNGREHIEYLPSQVVSEYFAQVYRDPEGRQIDGIAYPSAVRPGGKNLVIFPRNSYEEEWTDRIELTNASGLHLKTWADVKKAL